MVLTIGIPKMYWSGKVGDSYAIVMDKLGLNMNELINYMRKVFSSYTAAVVGSQMLSLIESIHKQNFIHRDIKPENFLIGNDQTTVYIIDFGLAKRYNAKVIKLNSKPYRGLVGTPRYASVNSHLGLEQSRRDDLESLCYVLVYLMKRKLPWQGLQDSSTEDKLKRILSIKQNITPEELCKQLPSNLRYNPIR